ncbi:DMT family transporter [Acinetobacter genomosp. 15BJ]|uniref:DMT family transporter n=1 Tax=Acinetobacter genomosp. 15BJ TaxID=106651 RepID=A0ABT8UVI8_9GAMM|nr:DMT family transporter [Acinetobacter genomosp. 15BJ]MCH7293455.1 DMT family transporter [Acinetobacter genomosp. 15BJ]MDO3657073.1 DMT family transporter [Acinetobacter genomosp. 15BJ]
MNIRVVSAIALLCLVWGSLWGLVKHSLQVFPPFLFISTRLILAALTLMLVQRILKKSILPQHHEWKPLIILSLLICFGFYATQTFAMQFVGSGLSAVLVFTMPIFIAVLAHYFLNERLNTQKILGLILGSLGLVAILWPQLHHVHMNMLLLGQVLLIGSGFFWALSTVYIKKNFATYDKIKLTIWQLLLGGSLMFVMALLFEPVDAQVWLNPLNESALFYIAVVGTGFAFVLWNWIVSQVDTFVASISIMCIPILSLFFGSLIWHEPLTLNILIGAAFICMGIVMSSLKMKAQKNRLAYSGNQQP